MKNNNDSELIIDGEKYFKISENYYYKPNEIILPIMEKIKDNSTKIKGLLRSSPAFIDVINSIVSNDKYQAVFTNEQKKKLAKGTVELMTSKNGNIIASIVDPKTKKIISNVKLEKINLSPELNTAINNIGMQVKMAQIAEDIHFVQLAVEEVRRGQENDRLAIAYSCEQKLLQAMTIENHNIRQLALLNLTASAEDTRNKLMLSQMENVEFLRKQPKDFWGKLISGAREEEKDRRISELTDSFNALNRVSLAEALSYQELGEQKTANFTLKYYGDFLNKLYLSDREFLERLDSLNPSPKKYWSMVLPDICKNVALLNTEEKKLYLEDIKNEKEN